MEQNWSTEVRCTGAGNDNSKIGCYPCGEKNIIIADDIFITYRKFWDGEKLEYFSVKCPHCNSITDLDETKIPENVKKMVIEKTKNKEKNSGNLLR